MKLACICGTFNRSFDTGAMDLTRFLQRHAAAVKFATAGLFLVLFVLFLWGDRLPHLSG